MPAFARAGGGPLTDAQVQVLAEGIKKRWEPAASGEATPPYLSPAGTKSGNLDEGARVFARACAGCHGRQGQGGEHGGRPVGAINDPAFLALISDKALRRTAITGRPDLGMPAYDGAAGRPADFRPLTSAQIDNLVALLASWRQGAPAVDQ
jgi:cytochrome c oxidase cbb3-type subunit 3/ubiquinol-cytochrome c reductase cytochrome c subunit